jgi:hypothetical protein
MKIVRPLYKWIKVKYFDYWSWDDWDEYASDIIKLHGACDVWLLPRKLRLCSRVDSHEALDWCSISDSLSMLFISVRPKVASAESIGGNRIFGNPRQKRNSKLSLSEHSVKKKCQKIDAKTLTNLQILCRRFRPCLNDWVSHVDHGYATKEGCRTERKSRNLEYAMGVRLTGYTT